MRGGETLALQLIADESTRRKHRQGFALPSRPYLIYILIKMWFLNSKAPLSKVVGDGALPLPYLDSAESTL